MSLTVTIPATVTALTTLATVKDELSIADTSADAALTRRIAQASQIIASYCGRVFGLESVSEVFRSGPETGLSPFAARVAPYGTPLDSQRRPLLLQRRPVTTLASVTDANGTLIENTDFSIDYPSGLMQRLFGTSVGAWSATPITVAYTAGFDLATSIPPDLESVAIALVVSSYTAKGRDPNIAMDMLDGDRSQFWDRSVTPMALDDGLREQLGRYREWAF